VEGGGGTEKGTTKAKPVMLLERLDLSGPFWGGGKIIGVHEGVVLSLGRGQGKERKLIIKKYLSQSVRLKTG